MSWACANPACTYENEAEDVVCLACEEPKPSPAENEDDDYKNFKNGLIVSCEDAPGTKLKRLKVDVNNGAPIDVVTAAAKVEVGHKVVIACVGAVVGGEVIDKTNVRGFPSCGMVCDSAMLGWSGGGAGAAVVLPDDAVIGEKPPRSRPRGHAKV